MALVHKAILGEIVTITLLIITNKSHGKLKPTITSIVRVHSVVTLTLTQKIVISALSLGKDDSFGTVRSVN